MKKLKNIIIISLFILSLIMIIAVLFTNYGDVGTSNDIMYYRLAMCSFFMPFCICLLFEFLVGKFKLKLKLKVRIIGYIAVICSGLILCGVFNSNVSKKFLDSIAPETTVVEFEEELNDMMEEIEEASSVIEVETEIEETEYVSTTIFSEETSSHYDETTIKIDIVETSLADTETTSETSNPHIETSITTYDEVASTLLEETATQIETNEEIESQEKPSVEIQTTVKNSEIENNTYGQLSDSELEILTEFISKSFYNFTLDDNDYVVLENNINVKECIEKIYSYAYENYFELDPDFVNIFNLKYDIISKFDCYELLDENFIIGYNRDSKEGKWIHSIRSYSFEPEDLYVYGDVLYIDPEGYLNPGVVVYWIEDEEMIMIGEIKDVAYNKEIDNTIYTYALNVEFYDDPYSSGWRDGESFLTSNKKLTGEPAYFISALDPNRNIVKLIPDYTGAIEWTLLKFATIDVGTEVYMGTRHSKTYMFRIIELDKKEDFLLVEYENGNIEYKSYSAIINNNALYVKD